MLTLTLKWQGKHTIVAVICFCDAEIINLYDISEKACPGLQ